MDGISVARKRADVRTTNDERTNTEPLTSAYVHWLVDVQLAGFAPALASLIFNSLCRFTTSNAPANGTSRETVTANETPLVKVDAHSHGRYGQEKEKKQQTNIY